MAQGIKAKGGGGRAAAPKKKLITKRQRTGEATRRPKVKRVNRSETSKSINKAGEKLCAGRVARAGGRLEMPNLEKVAKVECKKQLAETKASKKKQRAISLLAGKKEAA